MKPAHRIAATLALSLFSAADLSSQERPPWADPAVVSINQQPSHSASLPLGPPDDPDRWRLDLNGDWPFLLMARAADVPQDPAQTMAADARWSTSRVPGNWHDQGFAIPVLARSADQNPAYDLGRANPAGIYVREFTIPVAWAGRRTVLRLGRARSSVTVRLNGNDVGYSENAEAGADFDLSRQLVPGTNRLTLVVTEWSTSSELSGSHWTLAGLIGGVELLSLPDIYLHDLHVDGRFDPDTGLGTLDLRFWLRGTPASARGGYRIQTDLTTTDGRVVGRRFRRGVFLNRSDATSSTLRMRVPSVTPWSTDSPHLYRLDVHLIGPDGRPIQRSEFDVGFRGFTFGRGGLRVNEQQDLLRGVSLSPDLPVMVTDPAEIRRHVELMKAAGVNAVRLTVPMGRSWYDAFDALGILTVHDLRAQATADGSAPPFERANAIVEATKNRPSTLAWAWSQPDRVAGDELRAWLLTHDPTHPVLPNASIALVSKPRAWQLARRLRNTDRALLLWPFGSLLGNSGGGIRGLWDQVEGEPLAIGGFLPRWMVGALANNENTGSADAMARGLIGSDGQPLPVWHQVGEMYRPLRLELVEAVQAVFRLVNRSASEVVGVGRWALRQDGSVVAAGRLPNLGTGPGQAVEFTIPGLPPRDAAAEYHLTLDIAQVSQTDGDAPGKPLVRAQFALPSETTPVMASRTDEVPALGLDSDRDRIELGTREVTFRVDRTTGTLRYLALRGRPLIDGPVLPALWRMPMQLERANGVAEVDQRLRPVFDGAPADWVGRRVSASSYSSVSEYTVLDEGAMRIQTTLHGSGTAELGLHWFGEPGTADPPRLGLTIPLDERVATVEWFGRGPGESYINRLAGTEVGHWQVALPLDDPYYWVQAHGLRSQVRWLTIWFADGSGLLVVTPPASSFAVEQRSGDWFLELDVSHRGVGGERDDAVAERAARIPPGEYRATLVVVPLAAGSDPREHFRVSAHTEEVAAAVQSSVPRPAWSLAHLGRRRPLNLVESNADDPPTRRSGINDGWIGSVDARDGSWQPLDALPAEITIDLEQVETVRRLRLGVLANERACADLPAAVEFSYSTDRRRWVSLDPVTAPASSVTTTSKRVWLNQDLLGRPLRWVRARVLDPETDCADGTANRVLVDELVVE